MKNREVQLIDLYGKVTGVLAKNSTRAVIFFRDEIYGDLVCTANRDSFLYFTPYKEGTLHLKVRVGSHKKEGRDGMVYTSNKLVIQETNLIEG